MSADRGIISIYSHLAMSGCDSSGRIQGEALSAKQAETGKKKSNYSGYVSEKTAISTIIKYFTQKGEKEYLLTC